MLSLCICSIKPHLQNIINDLQVEDYQKKIIEQRYLKQVSLYDRKSRIAEFFYIFLSIFVTIATIILPALLSIQEIHYSNDEEIDKKFKMKIYWTTWVISLLITISNGLVQFLNLHKQFISFNQTKEKLLSEGWHYFELSGNYKNKTHSNAFIDFCEEVEKIKKLQVDKELMFINGTSDKKNKKEIKSSSNISDNILPVSSPYRNNINKSDNISLRIDENKKISRI